MTHFSLLEVIPIHFHQLRCNSRIAQLRFQKDPDPNPSGKLTASQSHPTPPPTHLPPPASLPGNSPPAPLNFCETPYQPLKEGFSGPYTPPGVLKHLCIYTYAWNPNPEGIWIPCCARHPNRFPHVPGSRPSWGSGIVRNAAPNPPAPLPRQSPPQSLALHQLFSPPENHAIPLQCAKGKGKEPKANRAFGGKEIPPQNNFLAKSEYTIPILARKSETFIPST
jgi:hypothetical protein